MPVPSLQRLQDENPNAIRIDGLDEAIVGFGAQCNKTPCIIYSARRILRKLMKDGLTYMEALDWYSCKVECLWAGENTPIIMHDFDDMDDNLEPTDRITKERNALSPCRKKGLEHTTQRKNVSRISSSVWSKNCIGS